MRGWSSSLKPMRQTFGGRAMCASKKTRDYVNGLIQEHSEDVIRGLLIALRHVEPRHLPFRSLPICMSDLAEIDLATTPLHEIIQPFRILGTNFEILGVDEPRYRVKIFAGYGNAGGGGEFLIVRTGDVLRVEECIGQSVS
jgi:hypothetical protein